MMKILLQDLCADLMLMCKIAIIIMFLNAASSNDN